MSPGTGFLYTLTTADVLALYAAGNTQFQSLLFDGFNLYLYDQYEAVVWLIAIDPTTAALSEPNPIIISTGQGNGGIAIFDTTPASLLIKDIATDVGTEPDLALAGGHPWESPDIAVTNTPLETPGALPTNVPVGSVGLSLASEGEITGSAGTGGPNSGYVYVRVTNFGATGGASTNGTEVLKVYWAASSAGLNWPTPWDGLETVPGTGTTAMIAGGQIGAAPLGQIDPGNETIFQFEWSNVPDPTQYNGHFCLLARIEASSLYPFGMTFPEETNLANEAALIQNVTDNSKIAWRNITIAAAAPAHPRSPPIRIKVLSANYLPRPANVRFGITTLNRDGRPETLAAKVVVVAHGRALQRLREAVLDPAVVRDDGDGRFELRNIAWGIGRIHLHAHETLPFEIEFTPITGLTDFVVRVTQYCAVDGVDKVVGGQTFVFGEVTGFLTR